MFIIGLTGGIACGKSAASDELRKFGAVTFDIDRETYKLLQPGGELYKNYVEHFGESILFENGNLNKRLIGEIIFHDEEERQWINSVAHPVLLNRTRDFLVKCAEHGVELVVLEVPLLFEAGWEFLVDEVWAVYVPNNLQIFRLVERDKITPQQAIARIRTQLPQSEIRSRADLAILNKGDRRKLQKKIREIINSRWKYGIKRIADVEPLFN